MASSAVERAAAPALLPPRPQRHHRVGGFAGRVETVFERGRGGNTGKPEIQMFVPATFCMLRQLSGSAA
eukprot:5462991-Prymnesium_polylepis.1